MNTDKIHPAQSSVLYTLRHVTRARYGELRRPTGMESDVFKYHIKKLMSMKYVLKMDDGLYELSVEGKEFANRLDERTGRSIEQPKPSMLMVVSCRQDNGRYFLAHQRTREPYRGFWGIASAPLLRGVPASESASRELMKQTGIDAQFDVVGTFRVIDKNTRGHILEDKLFSVMHANLTHKIEPNSWTGGIGMWMTRDELLAQEKLFPITADVLDMISHKHTFRESVCVYSDDQY